MRCKKGSAAIAMPLMLCICIFLFIIIGTYVISAVIPFIMHQKLQVISQKYMYVIEKFGYLTNKEKTMLLEELNQAGFEKQRVQLYYPTTIKQYGELIEFKIQYTMKQNIPLIGDIIGSTEKETILVVRKNSFSKIKL